jgi:signal transduction histidine kinase
MWLGVAAMRLNSVTWRDWLPPTLLLSWGLCEVWVPHFTNGMYIGPAWVFTIQIAGYCAALTVRRRHPLTAAFVTAGLVLVIDLWGWQTLLLTQVLAIALAAFACGRYGVRPWAYVGAPLSTMIIGVDALLKPGPQFADSWGWSLHTLALFAVGAAFRRERQLREQATRAAEDRSRAAEAEERLRVARELHDVLSHSLSVMVIQAEVADALFTADAQRARRAITQVVGTGRAALTDMRRLVGLLREPAADDAPSALPTLSDVPALVRRMCDAGLPVSLDADAKECRLNAAVSAAAYRVIQESLTNVLRHAGKVPTQVRVTHHGSGLEIEIHDSGERRPDAPAVAGNGLTGMRERVLALGGTLTCGPSTDGGFRVRARLPAHAEP